MTENNEDKKNNRPSKKKRFILIGAIVLLLIALLFYAIIWWSTLRFLEGTDDAYVSGNTTPMSPHINGFVSRILITDNQFVKAGDVLLTLDDRDYLAAQKKELAILKERQASLGVLQARRVRIGYTVEQLEASLQGALARAAYAAHNAARYHGLAARDASPEQEAERTLSETRVAKADADATKALLSGAKQDLQVVNMQIAETNALVEQADATLQQANLNLSYTIIKAPIDGYVGNRVAQTGSYVTSATYLLSIIPATGLWIDANFKEDQIKDMQIGQPVKVTADVLPGHTFHGHVLSIAPGTGAIFSIIPPENATGNFTKIVQRVPVRISLDAQDSTLGQLRPGLSTYVTVNTKTTPETSP